MHLEARALPKSGERLTHPGEHLAIVLFRDDDPVLTWSVDLSSHFVALPVPAKAIQVCQEQA